PCIDLRHGLSLVADLIVVRRSSIGYRVRRSLEYAIRIDVGSGLLRLRMGERHDDPFLDQFHGFYDLVGGDQVRCALIVVRAPLAPGFEFRTPSLIVGAQRSGVRRSRRSAGLRGCTCLPLSTKLEPADEPEREQPD